MHGVGAYTYVISSNLRTNLVIIGEFYNFSSGLRTVLNCTTIQISEKEYVNINSRVTVSYGFSSLLMKNKMLFSGYTTLSKWIFTKQRVVIISKTDEIQARESKIRLKSIKQRKYQKMDKWQKLLDKLIWQIMVCQKNRKLFISRSIFTSTVISEKQLQCC